MIIKTIKQENVNCICDYIMISESRPALNRDSSKVAWENICSANNPGIVVNFENTLYKDETKKKRLSVESPSLLALQSKTLLVNRTNLKENRSYIIAEIPFEQSGSNNDEAYFSFIDYGARHGEDYLYSFSIIDSNGVRSNEIAMPRAISPKWDHWTLLLGDNYINQEGMEDTNKVIVKKIFLFELNTTSGQMNLGTKFSQQENFTPYPKIQRSYAHNWSGSLKGLLGVIAPNGVDFVQTPQMLEEWKQLAHNTQRKFLKDRDGNIWEIELSGAPSINNTDNLCFDLKTKTLSWTEVGNAEEIALYAYNTSLDWVLTETGYPNPLKSYRISDSKFITNNEYLTDN